MMLTTLLLDWSFIQTQVSRQIIVYVFMLIIAFVGLRLLKAINTENKL